MTSQLPQAQGPWFPLIKDYEYQKAPGRERDGQIRELAQNSGWIANNVSISVNDHIKHPGMMVSIAFEMVAPIDFNDQVTDLQIFHPSKEENIKESNPPVVKKKEKMWTRFDLIKKKG